jgi:hypothetical protein
MGSRHSPPGGKVRDMISEGTVVGRRSNGCQAAASRRWLADREAELLPVPYFHVVYTLPSELRDIAYYNKRVVSRFRAGPLRAAWSWLKQTI